jgi:hypothetical protein
MARNKFDWVRFLTTNRIEFRSSGVNCSKGNLVISCPFCNESGNPDPSQHLGINLENGMWGCWRNSRHRGKNPAELISKLLKCSYAEAISMLGGSYRPTFETFDEVINSIHIEKRNKIKLKFPNNFYEIKPMGGTKPFFNYLEKRNFNRNDIENVCYDYGLRAAITGPWTGRLIIPVYQHRQLACWTARAIYDAVGRLRYMTTTTKANSTNGLELAPYRDTDCLLGFDDWSNDRNARILYVVEGPMDAIKLDYYGKPYGVRATCLFTNNITDTQRSVLSLISDNFEEVRIMLDSGWFSSACLIANKIGTFNTRAVEIPSGFKDTGEMSKKDIEEKIIF